MSLYMTILYVMLFMRGHGVFKVMSEGCSEHHGECVYNGMVF